HAARLPAGVAPWPGGAAGALLLTALLLGLLLLTRYPRARRLLAAVAIAVVIGFLPLCIAAPGWPPPGTLLVACDVGQGDAVVLPLGPGEAVVIDAGPDPSTIDACLRRLGVETVPLLVITHFHVDHAGGVDGVFRDRRVGTALVSAHPEPSAGRDAVTKAAHAHGVPVTPPPAGWTATLGRVRIDLLGPDRPLTGTRSDPNNYSLVLRAVIDGTTILLPGDARTEEQTELRARVPHADALKVPHHGSAYQDRAFLHAAHPSAA